MEHGASFEIILGLQMFTEISTFSTSVALGSFAKRRFAKRHLTMVSSVPLIRERTRYPTLTLWTGLPDLATLLVELACILEIGF